MAAHWALCYSHAEYKDEMKLICKGCRGNSTNSLCILCAEPWTTCLTCCKNFATRKTCYMYHDNNYAFLNCLSCKLSVDCSSIMTHKKQLAQLEWKKNCIPIVSCFLNRLASCFSSHIVSHLTTFLTNKDGYNLTIAILAPLLRGASITNWSPFSSSNFFNGFALYFKFKFQTFEEQAKELIKFNKQYLFQLFDLKYFRSYFPMLVSLPNLFIQILKDDLPVEFLEHVYKNYETR